MSTLLKVNKSLQKSQLQGNTMKVSGSQGKKLSSSSLQKGKSSAGGRVNQRRTFARSIFSCFGLCNNQRNTDAEFYQYQAPAPPPLEPGDEQEYQMMQARLHRPKRFQKRQNRPTFVEIHNSTSKKSHSLPLVEDLDSPSLNEFLQVQDQFRENYEVDEKIGKGGEGEVRITRRRGNPYKEYVVKELNVVLKEAEERAKSMRKRDEIKALLELSHPLVQELHEVFFLDQNIEDFLDNGQITSKVQRKFQLVGQLYEGGTLHDLQFPVDMEAQDFLNTDAEPLPELQVKQLAYQMIRAVNYLGQKGYVHNDIKLENFLLELPYIQGDKHMPLIKIIDFGCSNHQDDRNQPNYQIGTLEFCAPEVIPSLDSTPHRTQKSDMWSIGVAIYLLLSGSYPFHGEGKTLKRNIQQCNYEFEDEDGVWDSVSEEAKDFISKLLWHSEDRRYSPGQALSDKWFQDMNRIEVGNSELVEQMKRYRKTTNFFTMCQIMYETCIVDFEEQQEAKEAFLSINQSDSGLITGSELAQAVPSLTEQERIDILQNIGHSDNHIRWLEFLTACSQWQHTSLSSNSQQDPRMAAYELFNFIGKCGSDQHKQKLTVDEIITCFKQQSHKFHFLFDNFELDKSESLNETDNIHSAIETCIRSTFSPQNGKIIEFEIFCQCLYDGFDQIKQEKDLENNDSQQSSHRL